MTFLVVLALATLFELTPWAPPSDQMVGCLA
jgi:hypothetical protein